MRDICLNYNIVISEIDDAIVFNIVMNCINVKR